MVASTGITLAQVLVPVICAGTLLAGTILLASLYTASREPRYLATGVVSLLGFFFTAFEAVLVLMGGWFRVHDGIHLVHRLQQFTVAFFLVFLPYLTGVFIRSSSKLKRLSQVISLAGGVLLVFIIVAGLIRPEWFVSAVRHHRAWMTDAAMYARGAYGPLLWFRDGVFGLLIIYSLAVLTREMVWSRNYRLYGNILIGLWIACYFAVVDMLKSDTGIDLDFVLRGPLAGVSKFSVGVTGFVLFSILGVVSHVTGQSRRLNQTVRSLERSEKMFSQIADNIGEAFWLTDLRQGNTLYLNSAFERLWEMPLEEVFGDPGAWMKRVHPDDLKYVRQTFDRLDASIRLEYRLLFGDGRIKWVGDSIYLIRDEATKELHRIARVVEDITNRKKAEDELSFLAYYDALTLLPNRRSFFERFEDTLVRTRRSRNEKMRALVMLDLDNFKIVNDAFGHDVADRLLAEVSERVKACLNRQDYLFRLGSDEFVIILAMQEGEEQTRSVIRRIQEAILKPFSFDGIAINVSASFGVSLFPRDGETKEALVRNADIALSQAKKDKNTARFFKPAMLDEARHRMEFVNRLRSAVEKNEFRLVFQPFVDYSGRLAGAEALVRWQDSETGQTIPPAAFIPIAEETGLIIPLGEWIISEACHRQKVWARAGRPVRMSVNLSPRQFKQKDIVDRVMNAVRQSGISASNLDCEITESCVMENPEEAILKMRKLVDQGIGLSIDDFGTGYSSLAYLHRFPVQNLKIDRAFVSGLDSAETTTTPLVQTIISLAHAMELKTIAEGVETRAQAERLRGLSCDMYQGFFFSRPVAPEDFEVLMTKPLLPA